MSRIKSPIEKKQRAYQRDHFDWSEYPHRFRVTWPRKEALANRAYRRTVSQQLGAAQRGESEDAAVVDIGPVRRRTVRKWGAISLRDRVAGKIGRRLRSHGAKQRRRERRLKRQ